MDYFSETQLKEIVSKKIEIDEKLGEFAGGSGHLSDISYKIDEIQKPIAIEEGDQKKWRISFKYTKYVTTEFTYYPDNPPYEYPSSGTIIVDVKGNVIT